MKKLIALFLLISFISCANKSQISKDLNCNPKSYNNLEVVQDFKEKFSMVIPKTWKTNLYYDNNQTSIYTADTTENLTNTFTLDVTYVYNKLKFDQKFIQNFKNNLIDRQLLETTSYKLKFQEKDAYYSRSLGMRGQFNYQIFNLFIKVDPDNYIVAKAEVYGDSLVNERFCNALSLLEKLTY